MNHFPHTNPRALYALLLLAFLAPSLFAQETPPEGSAFFDSVNVDIVNVEVFVTDRQGNPISDLDREDFRLLVNGAEVPIVNFYAQAGGRPVERLSVDGATPSEDTSGAAEVPVEQRLHLVIFVDNLHLRAINRKKTFNHLREFLDNNLNPGDLVTVVSQNRSLFIHNDFLSDRSVLNDILDEVQKMATDSFSGEATRRRLFQEIGFNRTSLARPANVDDLDQDQALSQVRAYAEREFNLAAASIESLERLLLTLGGIKGRKAMIHVSDGIANRPGEALYEAWNEANFDATNSYERTIGSFDLLPRFRQLGRTANAAGVTFYAIDAESDHTAIGRSAALAGGEGGILPNRVIELISNSPRETLELTAQTTGGRRVQRTTRLTENLGQLATDFGTFYSLGFQATQDAAKDHRIEVKVEGKGLRVRHRETYQARQRDDQSGDFAMAALLYNAVDNPLGISLEPGEVRDRDDGTFMLTVLVKIPVKNLVLLPGGPNHSAQLSFFITMKDRAGDPRPVQKIPFHLPIPADKVEEARGHEAAYPLEMVIRPGDLQAVVAVRDDHASIESAVRMDLDRWAGVPVEKKRRNRTSP